MAKKAEGETAFGNQSAPLQEKAYGILKEMILKGEIKPGDRLIEAQVVRAFGISRSPARGALAVLCREQLIEESGKRGYRVAGGTKSADKGRLAPLASVKISQPRQWERVYSKVEQEIYAKILFGSVRINDPRLAQFYDVSRTVTRDILARMHGVGLISKDDAGHWVAQKVTPKRIHHLYQMRQLLEPQMLLEATPLIPRSLLARARETILKTMAMSPIDSAQFDRTEVDLHHDILGFSPNKEVLHALRRTHILFGPTRYLMDPLLGIPLHMIEDALNEHLEIIDHLLAGNAELAAGALNFHLQDAVDRWLGRFDVAAKTAEIEFPPYLSPVEDG